MTVPAGLAGYRSSHLTAILAPLAVVLLLLALVLPPVVAYRMSVKRRGASDDVGGPTQRARDLGGSRAPDRPRRHGR